MEWFNVPFLMAVLSSLWSDRALDAIWQRLAAYALAAGLLGVGGWYWHLKMLQIRDGRPIDPNLRQFDLVDRFAPAVLAAASLALVGSWLGGIGFTADRGWATGFLLLAWAEYVNYFKVQLMHDTRSDWGRLMRTSRLRRSWLASDLGQWRACRRSVR